MNTKGYELYTYFGRVIERLPFNENELAIHTQKKAYERCLELDKSGAWGSVWVRAY